MTTKYEGRRDQCNVRLSDLLSTSL